MADIDPALIELEIAALRQAIAAGVLEVETNSGGVKKKVRYPSFADLLERLRWFEGQLPPDGTPRRRGVLAAF